MTSVRGEAIRYAMARGSAKANKRAETPCYSRRMMNTKLLIQEIDLAPVIDDVLHDLRTGAMPICSRS